jgi:hypothetical protein
VSEADPSHDPEASPPAFDIEAARARYRRTMRGRPMRALGVFTILVILLSWAFGIAAAYAPDVDRLPGHDVTVQRAACLNCHVRQIEPAPPMNHPSAPSCGFCHMQGLPANRVP